MQIEVNEGKVRINRGAYKEVKRCDHKQMERVLQNVYEKGALDGKTTVPEIVSIRRGIAAAKEALSLAIRDTKGIGEKRREVLVEKFRKLVSEKELEEEERIRRGKWQQD